jgi:hypothetical protein
MFGEYGNAPVSGGDSAVGVEQGVEKTSCDSKLHRELLVDGLAIAILNVLGSNPMSSTNGTVVF